MIKNFNCKFSTNFASAARADRWIGFEGWTWATVRTSNHQKDSPLLAANISAVSPFRSVAFKLTPFMSIRWNSLAFPARHCNGDKICNAPSFKLQTYEYWVTSSNGFENCFPRIVIHKVRCTVNYLLVSQNENLLQFTPYDCIMEKHFNDKQLSAIFWTVFWSLPRLRMQENAIKMYENDQNL